MSPHLATSEAEVDMKHLLSTRRFQLLAAVSLALVILPAIEAEPRSPGNTASVTPRLVQHALIVIPVKINQAGPFDFMVDTGSQVTVIDPSLAAELSLRDSWPDGTGPLPGEKRGEKRSTAGCPPFPLPFSPPDRRSLDQNGVRLGGQVDCLDHDDS